MRRRNHFYKVKCEEAITLTKLEKNNELFSKFYKQEITTV